MLRNILTEVFFLLTMPFVVQSTNAARLTDADGKAVVGSGGYMYFGAARNLPGVRELLEKKQGLFGPFVSFVLCEVVWLRKQSIKST